MSEMNLSDYSAVLADMEAKRDALDAAIKSLRFAVDSGALTGPVGGARPPLMDGAPVPPSSTYVGEIPDGAFHGKNLPDAICSYLEWVRKKQTTRQIAEALIRGGMLSNSDNFVGNVASVLNRLRKTTGEIVRIQDSWGLADWLPPGFRPNLAAGSDKQKRESANRPAKNGRSSKKKQTNASKKTKRAGPPSSVPERLIAFLRSEANKEFTPRQIAERLGASVKATASRAGELAHKGLIDRPRPGVYRFSKDKVHQMPMAG